MCVFYDQHFLNVKKKLSGGGDWDGKNYHHPGSDHMEFTVRRKRQTHQKCHPRVSTHVTGNVENGMTRWAPVAEGKHASALFWVCVCVFLFSHSVMSDSSRPHGLEPARLLCPGFLPAGCFGRKN